MVGKRGTVRVPCKMDSGCPDTATAMCVQRKRTHTADQHAFRCGAACSLHLPCDVVLCCPTLTMSLCWIFFSMGLWNLQGISHLEARTLLGLPRCCCWFCGLFCCWCCSCSCCCTTASEYLVEYCQSSVPDVEGPKAQVPVCVMKVLHLPPDVDAAAAGRDPTVLNRPPCRVDLRGEVLLLRGGVLAPPVRDAPGCCPEVVQLPDAPRGLCSMTCFPHASDGGAKACPAAAVAASKPSDAHGPW